MNPHVFPQVKENGSAGGGRGLRLRDYFAAQALQALIMSNTAQLDAEMLVERAYGFADLMLEERLEGCDGSS